MKKLIEFIKAKEQDGKNTTPAKKQTTKDRKVQNEPEQGKDQPRDLYWDGYSDIGYC